MATGRVITVKLFCPVQGWAAVYGLKRLSEFGSLDIPKLVPTVIVNDLKRRNNEYSL